MALMADDSMMPRISRTIMSLMRVLTALMANSTDAAPIKPL